MKCQTVMIDGKAVRVQARGELTDIDRAAIAELHELVRKRMEDENGEQESE